MLIASLHAPFEARRARLNSKEAPLINTNLPSRVESCSVATVVSAVAELIRVPPALGRGGRRFRSCQCRDCTDEISRLFHPSPPPPPHPPPSNRCSRYSRARGWNRRWKMTERAKHRCSTSQFPGGRNLSRQLAPHATSGLASRHRPPRPPVYGGMEKRYRKLDRFIRYIDNFLSSDPLGTTILDYPLLRRLLVDRRREEFSGVSPPLIYEHLISKVKYLS